MFVCLRESICFVRVRTMLNRRVCDSALLTHVVVNKYFTNIFAIVHCYLCSYVLCKQSMED